MEVMVNHVAPSGLPCRKLLDRQPSFDSELLTSVVTPKALLAYFYKAKKVFFVVNAGF
jgi:hypothetical protein